MPDATPSTCEPVPGVLDRNLAALAPRSPRAAAAIRAATPRADLAFALAPDGGLTATLGAGPDARRLASRHAPIAEGEKLAAGLDLAATAAVVVRGFALGHHVAALARRLRFHGAVLVFEPDVPLLRAVLERVDCAPWITGTNLALLTDPDDAGAIAAAASGVEAMLASGTIIIDHPPSAARLSGLAERFAASFTTVMKAVRTTVVTTLVQVDVTVRNLLQNIRTYALAPGIADLAGALAGRPAVVVAAGPSLRRNIDLLAAPGVRDRVVIIAVQTVLKTLLARGIRPHFVTALDYHEISRRFYEGLTASDVDGVTLVAEAKANPAILEAFPGAVRCVGDATLDRVLGEALARPMGTIPPGATVAHLAYYLARHLGCDPVILVGQDLAFTDGQYYAPGAAIHRVWAGELSEFNTLEMLEWQRIARMRSLLRRATDVHGRPVYTDEQMSTYLVQFERDFMHDAARGLTTLDATEGGIAKGHTTPTTLAAALAAHAPEGRAVAVPPTPPPLPPARLAAVAERLAALRRDAHRVGVLSRETGATLDDMLCHQGDARRMDRLIASSRRAADEAVGLSAYWLVQYINQTGQLNRYRADRAIEIDDALAPLARQRKQIERDRTNVAWLADAAAHAGSLLDDALVALRTGRSVTGDITATDADAAAARASVPARSVWAVLTVDPERGSLGTTRDLAEPLDGGHGPNSLRLTLVRLARCARLSGVLILAADPGAARALAGTPPPGLRVEFDAIDAGTLAAHAAAVGAARLWSRHCWRGGLADLSCYDEALCPRLVAPHLASRAIDAALVLGPDWCFVDPALADAVIARHLERPDVNLLTFTQAAPGLAPCVIAASVVQEFAAAGNPFASIGGLLGYIPIAPQGDPIAKPACIPVPPAVRDALARCIADHDGARIAAIRLGPRAAIADAAEVAAAFAGTASVECDTVWADPRVPRPPASGPCVDLSASDVTGTPPKPGDVAPNHRARTIDGRGTTPALSWPDLVRDARAAGYAAVHLRTSLLGGEAEADALIDAAPDVISVDLVADSREVYLALTGVDAFDAVQGAMRRLMERRGTPTPDRPMPLPWIVPRITRRDAVYEQIEVFYARWLMSVGTCVIDPLPAPIPGERIEPLPIPPEAAARMRATRALRIAPAPVEAAP